MKPVKLALLLTALAFVGLQIFYYGQMPERVATHFDLEGNPNGWMSRTTNLAVSCGLVLFLTATFWFLPRLVKVMGGQAMNIPRKDYWLRPEHREELDTIITGYMSTLGLVMNLFFLYLFHQLYRFNTGQTDRVPLTGLIVFLAALLLVIIQWLRRLNTVDA